MSHRRPLVLVLALLALFAAALPASASAADATGVVIAREARVSGGQLDVRVLLTRESRRRLGTVVPAAIVRVRRSQLRSLTGTFRSPAKFLRLGDRLRLVGVRRSGARLRVRQLRTQANASLPTFSLIDRADTREIQLLLAGQDRAQKARSGDPAAAIRTLLELGALYNGVATTNEERATTQQERIDQARAQLPIGARRAAAAAALDRVLARPAAEVALRRSVARRLRGQVAPLDEEILRVGSGTGSTGGLPGVVQTVNGILSTLDSVLPGVGNLVNGVTGAIPRAGG